MPVAGRGTRLADYTRHRPKALLPLGDGTVIEWLLQHLARAVTDICLVVDDLYGGVRSTLGDVKYGVRLHYAVQAEPRGVGHAVLMAKHLLQGPFVVVMGDCYYDGSLAPYINDWRESDYQGAVLVEPARGPVGVRMGLVRLEDDDRVIEIMKEPFRGEAQWRVAGLTILPEAALDLTPVGTVQESREHDIEEMISQLIGQGLEFKGLRYRGWRRNINSPSDLFEVERYISRVGGK